MGEQKTRDDGGDISSGYGESEVVHPVSDEKAEEMLYGNRPQESGGEADENEEQGSGA